MNIRHLQLPLALALALGASSAQALGLGPIEVKSGLNQPLVAEIPILSAAPGELDELEVRLASPEAFARVGLERPVGLTANLQMSVGRNAAGQPVIRVTTPDRFNEPFLTFLLEANWGRGSVVREFSALVDPPYIAPAVIRPLEAPAVAVTAAPPPPPPPVYEPAQADVTPLPDPEPVLTVTDTVLDPAPPEALPEPPAPEPMPDPVAAAPEPVPPPQPEPEPQPVAAAEPTPEPAPPAPEPVPEPIASPPPAPAPAGPDSFGPVSEGQTLWSLASSARPDSSVTINQMMLALQRANPEAFIDDNINLLKRGAVLRIPARDEVVSLGAAEAAALVREQAAAWQARRQPVPQPAEAVAAAPAPSRPAARPSAPADGRLEIVPPSGDDLAARGVQSGASSTGGGNELRAELTQTREDLAAREAEVAELRSQMSELEQQQADSQRLIQMQNSQMKALQERLGQSPEPAVTAPDTAAAASATPAPATAEQPWYLNPLLLGGGGLVLLGGLVMALRGKRSSSPVPVVGRRISDDDALKASLAGTRAPAADEDLDDDADLHETGDAELARMRQAIEDKPDDLEGHIVLLRHYYANGDTTAFEIAAQAMRIRVRSTLDPRWREAVVMGVALSPGNPLFSQAGWNTPKFGDTGVMSATAAKPSPAPAPLPVPEPEPQPQPQPSFTNPGDQLERELQAMAAEPESALPEEVEDVYSVGPAATPEGDDGSETKIELAKAYLDIGDIDGAKGMLEEVVAEAGPAGRAEAERLLKEIG